MSMGFIRESLELKCLFLYVGARASEPLTLTELQSLTMIDDGVDYFLFSECLADLVSTEHLTIDQCGSYMSVNTPVVVKGRLSVRDEKPPQIMCDTIYPLKTEVGTVLPQQENAVDDSVIYLRVPSLDSREFRQIKRVMIMFEGETPVKIRLADTGKLVGTKCLNHPAFIDECRLWLGAENVVVKKRS